MQTKVHRIDIAVEGQSVFDLEGNLGAQMVHQVLPHAGQIMNDRYTEPLKLVLGADPR